MKTTLVSYYTSLVAPKRLATREVYIGSVPLGGHHPIRVQSMTTTDTLDTDQTVAQCIRLAEAGCDYIRITAPSQKEAENLAVIKKKFRAAGFDTPLIADIHYTPSAAEIAARIVEKVRINPGNYVDKKKFELRSYTPQAYQAELEKIRQRFLPLVKICKTYGTALRIGVNHGSLSDRIMSYYGDTPEGMVESAMEFVHLCQEENFHNLVISMKASNPIVMVHAYRLLIARMKEEGQVYPLHLGVTEAGDGVDGRVKSALGIGTLLAEGIGDTIRVSLTEPPENEPPVARFLISFYESRQASLSLPEPPALGYDPYHYQRRCQMDHDLIGPSHPARVIVSCPDKLPPFPQNTMPDYLYFGKKHTPWQGIYDAALWQEKPGQGYPFFASLKEIRASSVRSAKLNFVQIDAAQAQAACNFARENPEIPIVWVLAAEGALPLLAWRAILSTWNTQGYHPPAIVRLESHAEELAMEVACQVGLLLVDGLIDGLWIEGHLSPLAYAQAAFDILQGARARITRTEFIACPSCGRTLFDLEAVTAKIRARTQHLKGVKIAIMGCIVNGPGEMADADYGYVGAGKGTIHLYKGKEIVRRGVKEDQAVDALIELIRADGKWIDPPESP
ncbi:MAG: (E)-4-hydroxy-3-methylbut-2-enyl-diphosphate synthase [Bacteroidia bacterium]